ncbi:MAG: alpha/beta fold hydrolase [bacterium]|nr:alpha/beta fold hydrolase [bacterium]
MKRHNRPFLALRTVAALIAIALPSSSCALIYGVSSEPVVVWSEGTRLAGTLWKPDDLAPSQRLPAILLAHGWGGVRSHLDSTYAPKFAGGGFVVLTIDYRGWGDSDGKLVMKEEQPKPNEKGEVMVRAQVIREVVDPFDQLDDIRNALDFLVGDSNVDSSRIGIWGTSFAGGHVVWMGAHDSRIRAIVSQVGSQGAEQSAELIAHANRRAIAKSRGEIDPIPQGIDQVPGLDGTPDFAKIVRYRPIDHAERVRVPTLFIDAEDEELFDRMKNGHAAFEIISGNTTAEYETYPGSHYDIYTKRYLKASDRALAWFERHLKSTTAPGSTTSP